MSPKKNQAKVVAISDKAEQSDLWEQAEKKLRITAREARQRVKALRDELESSREQLEGAPFSIASGDMSPPASLDAAGRKYTRYLVEDFKLVRKGNV